MDINIFQQKLYKLKSKVKKSGKINTTSESRKAISNALDSHLVIIVPREEKENKAEGISATISRYRSGYGLVTKSLAVQHCLIC